MSNLNTIAQKFPDLAFLSKQVVDGFIIGLHKSPFHGFSVEFAEHRLYNNGDNLKHVDWKLFGKTDKMFSKKYEEETNLRCCIAIDTSASMYFKAENGKSKIQSSVEATACFIELLKRQMDASSIAFFDEQLYFISKTGTSNAHKNELFAHLDNLLKKPTPNTSTQISSALHELAERLHKRSLVVLFSDMLDDQVETENLLASIQHLRHNKHEVILFLVGDKHKEWNFDYSNQPLEIIDLESQETIRLQPDNVSTVYAESLHSYLEYLKNQCARMNVEFYMYDINESPIDMLRIYLMKRSKMM